jgi:hypothetical protein
LACGAIVAWYDYRSGNADIYARRVNASGVVQWTANGVALCVSSNDQLFPTITSDGAGGAIVTWYDFRSLTHADIYAQRINDLGAVQWPLNGVALCTAATNQTNPTIASDGAGGAIVTWSDSRSGASDIYAQRINSAGSVQWVANGVALCAAAGNQSFPMVTEDGAGGAVVTWNDLRGGNWDIYAQRVNALGVAQWAPNGVALCNAAHDQFFATIISDGAGGAIGAWQDFRSDTSLDIYAQRVSGLGVVEWELDGVALCTEAHDQFKPAIISDGAGGVIATWHDTRSGDYDIYAQRVSSGVVQWTVDGAALCTAPNSQLFPTIVADGAGGGIVTWHDTRNGPDDIYAQHVDSDGTPTGVGDTPSAALTVLQNHPNPFGGRTEFEVELTQDSDVRVDVFDVTGRRVRTIDVGDSPAGWRTIAFDGHDDGGRPLASGVYFYRVSAGTRTITNKMVLMR